MYTIQITVRLESENRKEENIIEITAPDICVAVSQVLEEYYPVQLYCVYAQLLNDEPEVEEEDDDAEDCL